ncbi:MAG: arylsulfatase [Bacteroidia bacterium]|nr:arylsulfatase [Bacteroidia bacterium]
MILLAFSGLFSCKGKEENPIRKTPNIVLIVADDMGYSDLGCFGSEIATPNIDALASQGQLFTSYYTAATCSPTRAMLLSGTDNHIAGLGDMAERSISIDDERGKPGYEGYLNNSVVSVAQLLKDGGYHTYIAGKWHLGLTSDQSPEAKGFGRSFALLDAAANHYYPSSGNTFWEDDHFTNYPEGLYSTDLYTDKLINFLSKDYKDNKPFFLYAAYTSPHWPLQAPAEYIEKYHGTYDIGYDSLRILRLEGLKKKGIIDAHVTLPKLPDFEGDLYSVSDQPLRSWKSLTKAEQRIEARKMEIYAGMIDNLDHNIGRLIQYLKEIDEFDNTLFVFFSDNGSSSLNANSTPNDVNPYPHMGTANSFVAYGSSWAHASSASNSFYKGYSSEGGIHTPMIIKMPNQKEGKGPINAFTTVMDMVPTFLELAEATYPTSYQGRTLTPLKGESILPLLFNKKKTIHNEEYVMGWELFGRCALRKGKWKITKIDSPFGNNDFQLFNIEEDPTESNDMSAKFPDTYQELILHWKEYVKENGVILSDQ